MFNLDNLSTGPPTLASFGLQGDVLCSISLLCLIGIGCTHAITDTDFTRLSSLIAAKEVPVYVWDMEGSRKPSVIPYLL